MTEPNGHGAVSLSLLKSREFAQDPYSFYERWREQGVAHEVEESGAWLVLGYDAVSAALKDAATFSSNINRGISGPLHGSDSRQHSRLRKIIQPLFSVELQQARRGSITTLVKRRIEELHGVEHFDAVADMTAPIVHAVTCDWLGLQSDLAAEIRLKKVADLKWSDVENAVVPGGLIATLAENSELREAGMPELVGFFLMAGVETTREAALLTLAMLSASRRGTALENPLSTALTDELLRLEPPVHAVARSVTSDAEVGGTLIPGGSVVWLSIGAANRDPRVFSSPEELIPGRPPRHISFGGGSHFCPGLHLGRIELEVMVSELLPHLDVLAANSGAPRFRFSGPDGAPALRQIAQWTMSFRDRA